MCSIKYDRFIPYPLREVGAGKAVLQSVMSDFVGVVIHDLSGSVWFPDV